MSRLFPVALLAAACVSTEPSGRPLEPVPVKVAPAAPVAVVDPGDPNSPFIEDDPFAEPPPDPDKDPSGADAVLKGLLGAPVAEPRPAEPPPPPAVPAPAPPPIPTWDGVSPLEGAGSWGVALIGTMLDLQPPRAVIALPDGTERVVQPGAFLPEHRLVVLAVGRDAIQVAHVEPMGFMAKVETSTLRSLYPTP